ncbi:hemolysin family protein [Candidatus Nitrosotalea bavarica]|uniref:hemolysin family protein n=1 Tax=Candidatus Nitrosotalea bavarica TaxID=1903277 RepID=UPI000C70B112|nr:hemolysin family protein [Candidatus Nitrosotalea bavarica]
MPNLTLDVTILAIMVGLSGFFSGSEIALIGISKAKVNQLVKEKVKGSTSLYKLKSNPSRMLATLNLGTNLVNVGSSALATEVSLGIFGDNGLAIAIGIMTFVLLVFGEITPKAYCNANATKISLKVSRVILVFSYVFYPFVLLFEKITNTILKVVGSSHQPPPITEQEIYSVIEQGLEDKALQKHERELVHGALKFDDIVIRAVMTPRTKMFMLPAKTLLFDAMPLISKSGYSRIPIYKDTPDQIVGILNVRDLLKHLEKDEKMLTLESLSRKPIFVSQEQRISKLLREMQGRQTHIAIVVDEFGGVEGCVTLEDLLEEIVGEIMDETDLEELNFKMLDKNTMLANGDVEIDTVNEILKSDIPQGEDYSTLNALLHDKLKDIPKQGDRVIIESIKMTVEEAVNNQASRIKVEKMPSS